MKRAFSTILLLCTALVSTLAVAADLKSADTTVIDPSNRAQTLEGWGTSLCWWANMVGRWQDEAALDSLLTLLVSPDHLGYNIFRYNIGGGDNPQWSHCTPHHFGGKNGKGLRAEMEGFQDERGGAFHWERDKAQISVLRKIHEQNPQAIFEAFSNSAPWWMTVSGCAGGAETATSDNLNPDYYTDFANYLIVVCRHLHESYGITFRTLEPFNEPVTDYWYRNGSQEGCHVSPEAQVEILRILAPLLRQSGLSTGLSASDETSVRQSIYDFHFYKKEDALQLLSQWNVHTYKANDEDRMEMRQLAEDSGLRLWMSESGMGGHGIHGNLLLAQRLISDMRILRPTAWVDWQYVEEQGDQWSLIESHWESPQFRIHKNYWVRYQFSHFIRPGYTFLDTDNPNLLAAISPDEGTLVLVIVNTSENTNSAQQIDLTAWTADKGLQIRCWRTSERENAEEVTSFSISDGMLRCILPPLSVATFTCVRRI